MMLASLVVLILIAVSGYSALFFCCFATDYYGLWLQTYHRKDLTFLRVLVGHSQCENFFDFLHIRHTLVFQIIRQMFILKYPWQICFKKKKLGRGQILVR